jgi:hypothetical protein
MYIMKTFNFDWWFSNLWLFIITKGWTYLWLNCMFHLSPSTLLLSAQSYCPLPHPATGHQYGGQKIQTRGPDDLGSNADWATSLIYTGKMVSPLICHESIIHIRNSIQRLFSKTSLDLVFLYLLYSKTHNFFYTMYSYSSQAAYKGLMLVVLF